MKKLIFTSFLMFFAILPVTIFAQYNVSGFWEGNIKVMDSNIGFNLEIYSGIDSLQAKMSIPQQGLNDYKLETFSFDYPNVYFELNAGAGTAVFNGTLKADSINGDFSQSGFEGKFYLVRSEKKIPAEQPAPEPKPYHEEEVTFNNGNIKLAGTISFPQTIKDFPTVILISGSGPQSRDEEVFGFKVFAELADYLTRNGIAVLRYDDRGVGGSTGNTMMSTSEDFAQDVLSAIEYLKSRKDIDKNKIGLIGHSEGGIIAPMAASTSDDVAFIILLSGTGVKGGKVLLKQQELILRASGVDEEFIKANTDLQKKINKAVEENKSIETVADDIRNLMKMDLNNMSEEVRKNIKDKDAYINSAVKGQISAFSNPWFRFFIKYDPAPALEKVQVPVLMIFGGLDLQVSMEQNKPVMEAALEKDGNNNYKTIVFPNANHLYQSAKNGTPSEYPNLPKEFVPGFLSSISDWIHQLKLN